MNSQEAQLAGILARLESLESPASCRLAYTIDEAIAATGCTRDAVSRAIHSKALPAKKIGQRWIVTRDALLRWLAV